jgi:hypothetical protein
MQTGLIDEQLIENARESCRGWRVKGKSAAALIQALCDLSAAHPEKAAVGFSPADLYEHIANPAQLQGMADKNLAKEIGAYHKDFEAKQEALVAHAIQHGLSWRVGIEKKIGGGAGNRSLYRLIQVPLERPTPQVGEADLPSGGIRYICEDSLPARGWTAALARGIDIQGWRRGAYITAGILTVVVPLLLLYFAFVMSLFAPATRGLLNALVAVVVIAVVIYQEIFPIFQVVNARILQAPLLVAVLQEDALLEWRCPPKHATKSLRLVRYSGKCTLCGGRVSVARRRLHSAPADLVGRCEDAPNAHVFSFDHIARSGEPLRSRPWP